MTYPEQNTHPLTPLTPACICIRWQIIYRPVKQSVLPCRNVLGDITIVVVVVVVVIVGLPVGKIMYKKKKGIIVENILFLYRKGY